MLTYCTLVAEAAFAEGWPATALVLATVAANVGNVRDGALAPSVQPVGSVNSMRRAVVAAPVTVRV